MVVWMAVYSIIEDTFTILTHDMLVILIHTVFESVNVLNFGYSNHDLNTKHLSSFLWQIWILPFKN